MQDFVFVFSCFGQTEAILTILDSNSDISISNIVSVSHYLVIQLDLIRSEKHVKRICIGKKRLISITIRPFLDIYHGISGSI